MKKKKAKKKYMKQKEKLIALSNKSHPFISVLHAKKAFQTSNAKASQILSTLAKQGWLKRVLPGVYIPIFPDISPEDYTLDNPWVLMPFLFSSNYYIGGLSVAPYYDLTDQTFKDTFVFTTKIVQSREMILEGRRFIIKTIKKEKMFGKEIIWRGNRQIFISNVYKTLVDMLDDPFVGGGIHHVFLCFENFIKKNRVSRYHFKSHTLKNRGRHFIKEELDPEILKKKDFDKLIKYSKRNKNGAVLKRLGFFAEIMKEEYLANLCKKELTKGYSKLDPLLECGSLKSKWRLWIPKNFKIEKNI